MIRQRLSRTSPKHALLVAVAALVALPLAANAETPLERGRYLMQTIVACGNCHTPQGPQGPVPGRELAGGTPFKEPFGVAYAPNITPDKATGIGSWTDDQIIAAIREGRRPDGSIIGPPMPIALYRGMADADARAIVAYLRQVKPVSNKVEKSAYAVPLPPSYGPPVKNVSAPAPTNKVAYGAYLAGPLGHCIECHSTPNEKGIPDFVNRTGGGGLTFNGPWGVSAAPNITPTALGKWSDQQIKAAITTGVRPDGARLHPPMAFGYYKGMRPADLDAIVAYLRTLKPL
jgi:mono/diheme cytochrome c family protein